MRGLVRDTLILTKAGLIEAFHLNKVLHFRTNQGMQEKMQALAFVALLLFGFPLSYGYYDSMADAYSNMGQQGLTMLLYMNFFTITMVTLFMCVSKASGFLFAFKDFDMLFSFPIKEGAVVASKIFMLYLSNMLFYCLLGIPAFIVYGQHVGADAVYYGIVILILLFMPVIPIIIGSLLALLVSVISARFKYSNLLMLAASTLLIFAYMAFNTYLGTAMSAQASGGIDNIIKWFRMYLPFGWYADALLDSKGMALTLGLLVNVLLMLIFVIMFARSFKLINGKLAEHASKSNYKMKEMHAASPLKALCVKELKAYFSSYIYVMNTLIGMVLFVIFVGYLLVEAEDAVAKLGLSSFGVGIETACMIVAGGCIVLNCTTCCSISMEGKTVSLLQSFPLRFKTIAMGKILMNLLLTVPVLLVGGVIILMRFHMSMEDFFAYMLMTLTYSVFIAISGLIINLLLPKMQWKSEIQVVKQSAATLVALAVNGILVGGSIWLLLKVLTTSMVVSSLILGVVFWCMIGIAWYVISKYGDGLFQKI